MSYVALATDTFEESVRFYRETLGFDVLTEWDRPRGRGIRFDVGGGLRLELLDNAREPVPLMLGDPQDGLHIVIEVDDVQATWRRLAVEAAEPTATSWGARLIRLRDPGGVAVTFLQWDEVHA